MRAICLIFASQLLPNRFQYASVLLPPPASKSMFICVSASNYHSPSQSWWWRPTGCPTPGLRVLAMPGNHQRERVPVLYVDSHKHDFGKLQHIWVWHWVLARLCLSFLRHIRHRIREIMIWSTHGLCTIEYHLRPSCCKWIWRTVLEPI